jgi:hypothetical protein
MKYSRRLLIMALICISGCKQRQNLQGIYRYYHGEEQGYKIWIVDGYMIRRKIYDEFLYGGNEQRYPFVPAGEIWIDHAVSCEEYEMTLAHELNERHLMAVFGSTYYAAHDSSLAVEVEMRRRFWKVCRDHESSLPKFSVLDYDKIKEISDTPDSVQLKNIYRVPLGTRNSISIWVVDGYLIRQNFYPDFGFSGNDLAYSFIPPKEIWIDGQVSAEETEYSIMTELNERNYMLKGKSYAEAYELSIAEVSETRNKMEELIRNHPPLIIGDSLTRAKGVTKLITN